MIEFIFSVIGTLPFISMIGFYLNGLFFGIFVVVTIVAMLAIWVLLTYVPVGREKKKRSAYAIFIIGATVTLFWLSLFLSRTSLPPTEGPAAVASTGGFPLVVFFYPSPPMGNDVIPLNRLPAFYFNYLFWFVLSVFVALLIPDRVILDRRMQGVVIVLSVFFTLVASTYLLLAFD